MSKLRIIITRITAMLCIAAVLVTVLPVGETVEAATKVSASEKTKVKNKVESISDYLMYTLFMYCTRNPKTFRFDNKRKTDIAIHYLPYDATSSEYKNEDYLFDKYNCYAGVYRYSNKMKSLAKKRGKQLFGNSYNFSIAMEKKNENKPYLYPLTSDKKYIKMDAYDWGDYGADITYKSISKSSGVYTVKLKIDETLLGRPTGYARNFTVKLKKQGKSLIFKDIKIS